MLQLLSCTTFQSKMYFVGICMEFRVFRLIGYKVQRVWEDSKSPDAQQTHYVNTMPLY